MLLFGIFARLIAIGKLSARTSTIIFIASYIVGFPLLVATIFGTIGQLFSLSSITTALLQSTVVYATYHKLETIDPDAFLAWIGWCIGGAIAVIIVIPYVVMQLTANLV